MPPKRAADASASGESKKRKAITMEVKLDIIKGPMKAMVIMKQQSGLIIEMF